MRGGGLPSEEAVRGRDITYRLYNNMPTNRQALKVTEVTGRGRRRLVHTTPNGVSVLGSQFLPVHDIKWQLHSCDWGSY